MKKIVYLLIIAALTVGFCSCGSSGGGEDDPGVDPPVPEVVKPKTAFALKSGITGVGDADLKKMLTHVRLYLYDKDNKLNSVHKYKSAEEVKAMELEKGTYTVVLIGNVPEDANISAETIGTSLEAMSVQLTKKEGAVNYSPLGDVLFAKNTLTVADADIRVDLSVKRTLSATKLGMTDYSGQVSKVGILVPGVGTSMGFGDSKWVNPGTVFVPMTEIVTKAIRADQPKQKSYNVAVNLTVVTENGTVEAKIQCNIVAEDKEGKIVVSQVLDVPAETRPNTEVTVNISVKASGAGDGKVEISVADVSTIDESGKKEEIPPAEVEMTETEITVGDLLPGDWVTGNDEEVVIGDPSDTVRPGGNPGDWESGQDESVEIGDKTKSS